MDAGRPATALDIWKLADGRPSDLSNDLDEFERAGAPIAQQEADAASHAARVDLSRLPIFYPKPSDRRSNRPITEPKDVTIFGRSEEEHVVFARIDGTDIIKIPGDSFSEPTQRYAAYTLDQHGNIRPTERSVSLEF